MPKVKNWSLTLQKNVQDVKPWGVVREWENDKTDSTVSIFYRENQGGSSYQIRFDGETVDAAPTLQKAIRTATIDMKKHPNGF